MSFSTRLFVLGLLVCSTLAVVSAESPTLHLANPQEHPYADGKLGREGYRLAGEEVNSLRIYDFYSRQADYHMATGVPRILPASTLVSKVQVLAFP